jgi:hypothetical protein
VDCFPNSDGGGLQQQVFWKSSLARTYGKAKAVMRLMHAAQKGASNVYFADTKSAIYVPNWMADQSSKIAANN